MAKGHAETHQKSSNQDQDGFLSINNERFFKISNIDSMPPFFMNIVSDSDFWLFTTSTCGITAGRANAEKAIFPYMTNDKLHDSVGISGPLTILRFKEKKKDSPLLWQPLHPILDNQFKITRNIYKNITGNKVIFEEINNSLQISFTMSLTSCDRFGLVRSVEITNHSKRPMTFDILDGLLNILPAGMSLGVQTNSSTLGDAYKWSEKIGRTSLAVFIMNSALTDRAEPKESLSATIAWNSGLDGDILLSSKQIGSFRKGEEIVQEKISKGTRGCYLVTSTLKLKPKQSSSWYIMADTGLNQSQIATLLNVIKKEKRLPSVINDACIQARKNLEKTISSADALQTTGNEMASAHHFANVLFNCMRGGAILDNYMISRDDFRKFITTRNRPCASRQASWINNLPEKINRNELVSLARTSGDTHLIRLTLEYLPIAFSRRHGDPSRPWNKFNIRLRDPDGGMALNYEGNWRDIFQNWEALFVSFPSYFENAIAKFVNAMTVDGYNPYRISREGIDWEKLDIEDPWAFIGYWGDHQVIYLLKLLEWMEKFFPGRLAVMLSEKSYSYANVPYRIKSYADILKDPHNTIHFDNQLEIQIEKHVSEIGTDGRLILDNEGAVKHVTLAEKLLLILLAKMVNFVPGGGIWMNTQRPEWNDANNALAGYGISMVTLPYLRRYTAFLLSIMGDITISESQMPLLQSMAKTLEISSNDIRKTCENNTLRKRVMDELNMAGETYRNLAYEGRLGAPVNLPEKELKSFLENCLSWMDATISMNERDDKLYHSYNLIHIEKESIGISPLAPMLEGQVAALASGSLKPEKAIQLLKALRQSDLYRKDQKSYLLYPVKEHPYFMDRNIIPETEALKSELIRKDILTGKIGLIIKDPDDKTIRFAPHAENAKALIDILERIGKQEKLADLVMKEKKLILDIYEKVFNHHSFTGRSGSMFGYEGIGCIYWHMVAKLVLAAEETTLLSKGPEKKKLKLMSRELSLGLGYTKSPQEYGAFPTDPYSHTPAHSGAQQPGMTGQVKEEVLIRWSELGVLIKDGCIHFNPYLLQKSEFLTTQMNFEFYDIEGKTQTLPLTKDELAFTFCQVPIIYQVAGKQEIKILFADGTEKNIEGSTIDESSSAEIFLRSGKIRGVRVMLSLSSHTL